MAKYQVTILSRDEEETIETIEADSYAAEVGLATFYKGGVGPVASFKAERVVSIKRLSDQSDIRAV